jgi:hypothetical protein
MTTAEQADPEGKDIMETLPVGAASTLSVDPPSTPIVSGVSVPVLALGIMRADTKVKMMSTELKIAWYFMLLKFWVFGVAIRSCISLCVSTISE